MRIRLATICIFIALCLSPHRSSAQRSRGLTVEIPKNSFELRSDKVGTIYPLTDDSLVLAAANFGMVLCTDQRSCSTLPEKEPAPIGKRALILDLTQTISNSGSRPLGIVEAHAANFGAFWGQDKSQRIKYGDKEGWVIRSVLDIPVDSTVLSERTEIRFFLRGRQYILQFGPWVAGQYQSSQGSYNGNGTTRATIKRENKDTWVLDSGLNSVGRLWDNSDPLQPADMGLYRFRFYATFTSH